MDASITDMALAALRAAAGVALTGPEIARRAGIDADVNISASLYALHKRGRVIRHGYKGLYRYTLPAALPDAAPPQPEVGQNTGSARPDPGPAVLPASAGARAAAIHEPGAPTPGAASVGIALHNDGKLTIATKEAVVELDPAQVLELDDFLALTERAWRP